METRYPSAWNLRIDTIQDDVITVRANLTCLHDAVKWVRDFGAKNNTGWIVGRCYRKESSSSRYTLHKRWVCQRNGANKTAGSHRSTSCQASIDILVKVITKNTKRTDSYLKMSPPLGAVIKIVGRHNHSTNTAEALGFLRGGSDTKAAFEEYFDGGMTAAEARRFHQEVLQANDSSDAVLDNSALNPSKHTVYYWHHCHRVKAASKALNATTSLAKIRDPNLQEGTRDADAIRVKEEPMSTEDPVDVKIECDDGKLDACDAAKNNFVFVDQSTAWKTECQSQHTVAPLEDDPLLLKQEPELDVKPELENQVQSWTPLTMPLEFEGASSALPLDVENTPPTLPLDVKGVKVGEELQPQGYIVVSDHQPIGLLLLTGATNQTVSPRPVSEPSNAKTLPVLCCKCRNL